MFRAYAPAKEAARTLEALIALSALLMALSVVFFSGFSFWIKICHASVSSLCLVD